MGRKFVVGDADLEKALKSLADKQADYIARTAAMAGVAVLAKVQREAAPEGPTGSLAKSIRGRIVKGSKHGGPTAKAGINVGKQKSTAFMIAGRSRKYAPHSHLVALGTKPRQRSHIGGKFGYLTKPTQGQLSTGTMPSNPFLRYASAAGTTRIRDAMRKRAARGLIKAAKLVARQKELASRKG